jgi:hypothetical protein
MYGRSTTVYTAILTLGPTEHTGGSPWAVHEGQALWTKNISGAWAPRSVPATERKMARGGKRKYAANRASIPRDSHTQIPHRPPPTTHAHPPHPSPGSRRIRKERGGRDSSKSVNPSLLPSPCGRLRGVRDGTSIYLFKSSICSFISSSFLLL